MATKRTSGKPSTKKAAAKKSTAKKQVAKSNATKKTTTRNAGGGKAAHPAKRTGNRWSKHVMETSDAMDLERNIFRSKSPRKIALSLKRSAEQSHRRKAEPFQSAMSMLNFYINRGGKNLSASQTKILERAKDELRQAFGRENRNMPEKKMMERARKDAREGKAPSTGR
jgi:hypothetical protein